MVSNYCSSSYTSGGIEQMRIWNEQNIANNKEHDEVFRVAAGISRELVWIQHLPWDFAIASYETNDPEQSFKILPA
jgi:hypothetical protein